MTVFSVAVPGERFGALNVWRTANTARRNPPSRSRIVRVQEKLDDGSACLVVGSELSEVLAMALAEPARERHGAGAIRPGSGHVSMVFVHPKRWGCGVGAELLDALHREMQGRQWGTSSLWTRSSNKRARRLYEGRGYSLTGDVKRLAGGDEIVRYEIDLDGSTYDGG